MLIREYVCMRSIKAGQILPANQPYFHISGVTLQLALQYSTVSQTRPTKKLGLMAYALSCKSANFKKKWEALLSSKVSRLTNSCYFSLEDKRTILGKNGNEIPFERGNWLPLKVSRRVKRCISTTTTESNNLPWRPLYAEQHNRDRRSYQSALVLHASPLP